MNCKHLKYRTKKGIKYIYCSLQKKEINYDVCKECLHKEYKMHNYCANNVAKKQKCTIKPKSLCKFKSHKHKLTKATEIPSKVKKIVWERDNHCCIYCHKPVSLYFANSHYIKRSQLGKGIEENVVTACYNCHYLYDFKDFDEKMKNYTKEYLKSKYSLWNEELLVYKKNN